MTQHRTIKLNPQIRRDMAYAIHSAWLAQHPRPRVTRLPSGAELNALDAWKADSAAYYQQAMTVLATFRTLDELAELWPAVMTFVPQYVLDPANHFALPTLPRKKAA